MFIRLSSCRSLDLGARDNSYQKRPLPGQHPEEHAWSHGCLGRRLRRWFIDCCFLPRSRSQCFWHLHFSPPVSLLKRSYFQVTFMSIICLNTLCDPNLSTRSTSHIFLSKCKPLRVQSAEMPHTSSFFEELVISFIWALHSALIPVSLF